jgi:glycosyltransferase involved in cell wall biosynthesis
MVKNCKKKILLIENFGADFYSARIPFANFLKDIGYDVYALVPDDEFVQLIKERGIQTITYSLNRKDKGVFQIFRLAIIYNQIIQKYNFDIIHSFRFQPNLINVLANIFSKKKTILHVTGLGIAFSNESLKYKLYKLISQLIYQFKLLSASKLLFQNFDDIKDLWFSSYWEKKVEVVKGSGVNTTLFSPSEFNKEIICKDLGIKPNGMVFLCVTRLLWEKGIKELCEAFTELTILFPNITLLIAGWSDLDNPRHVTFEYIESFAKHGNIHFLGKRGDIKELLSISNVFIYPSYYREGIPRSILEALAMGKVIITTKTAGCNLTVIENMNGLLISPRSIESIKDSVSNILNMDIQKLGKKSREMAVEVFSENVIFNQIEFLYNKL